MKQRWAMFLLGAWLCGTVIASVVAAENFYTVDRLLAGARSRAFASQVDRLGQPDAREMLRYLSSELNRLYFQLWNVTQLPVGVLLLWLLGQNPTSHSSTAAALRTSTRHAGARRVRWGIIGMLGIVVLMTLWLTPAITSLGRSLDFVPRDPPPAGFGRFWMLHGAYVVLDAAKLLVGVTVAICIARAGKQDK